MSNSSSRQMEHLNAVMAQGVPQLLSVTTIEGRLSVDPKAIAINKHGKEIELLKREIHDKNEAISRLESDIKELREENDDLKVTVEFKNKEIKGLKDKIDKLESEKKALETKLKSVEVELEAVKEEVTVVKTANKATEEKNVALEEHVEKLSTKMDRMKNSLDETKNENTALKEKVQNLEEAVHQMASGVSREGLALPNLNEPLESASLVLGELCWRIQAMMYKAVHPNLYDERKSYKIKHIEEDINDLAEEKLRREARHRWETLQKKLKWKKRLHTRAMKSIQESRNIVAHPDLNEEVLVVSARLMESAGKLTNWHSPDCIKEFIEMWKTMTSEVN